jgi:ParB family chromosome partitioning protein
MSIYDKLGAKTAGIKARTVDKPVEKTPRTAPGMFLNATQRIDTAEARVEELEAMLKEADALSMTRTIALSELHEVAGRRRRLTDAEYAELKENLRNNELVQAITVRPRTQGGYEVISGNNRVAIYRELGRTDILAVIQSMDDEQADLGGFYANLLQPSLPDFEKYLGFKRRQEHTNKNQKELAQEAGIPEQTLSDLFGFDKLPAEARAILEQKPHLLGSSAALKLALAAAAGRSGAVIEAMQRLAADPKFTQAQAVAYANRLEAPTSTKAGPIVIKDGKKAFCKLNARQTKVVLDFRDEALADHWLKKLEDFMRAELKGQK